MTKQFKLTPGKLELQDLQKLMHGGYEIILDKKSCDKIISSRNFLEQAISENKKIYGVNTGFGLLAKEVISKENLVKLQENIILSHATGVGNFLSPEVIRIILVLKINSLAMGYSGIRLETIQELINLYNNNIIPCIPEKGSVGASGDLAPLAHLVAPLLGYGEVYYNNQRTEAKEWLDKTGQKPYNFAAKEGLALLNGTQVSAALAVYSLLKIKHLFNASLYIGAMSVDASAGSSKPFHKLVSEVRNQPAQLRVANKLFELLSGSEIIDSHDCISCSKVQDPYSLRCQPQVMGACLQQIEFAESVITNEINAVTDNPLIFSDEKKVLFGGNFHAEPIGFAADNLALVIAEIGSISERRTAVLVDKNFSGLSAFLVKNSGLNSGFMMAQVTAAALVSENKALATPTVIDSIPTSANQEDHVSMATYGARRLITMVNNGFNIVAIELLAAAQGIDLRRPLSSSPVLEKVIQGLREHVEFYETDRYFHRDLVEAEKFIKLYNFQFSW